MKRPFAACMPPAFRICVPDLMFHPRFCTYVHTGDARAAGCFGSSTSHGHLMRYSENRILKLFDPCGRLLLVSLSTACGSFRCRIFLPSLCWVVYEPLRSLRSIALATTWMYPIYATIQWLRVPYPTLCPIDYCPRRTTRLILCYPLEELLQRPSQYVWQRLDIPQHHIILKWEGVQVAFNV